MGFDVASIPVGANSTEIGFDVSCFSIGAKVQKWDLMLPVLL